jgi:signal transduction histidine kinase
LNDPNAAMPPRPDAITRAVGRVAERSRGGSLVVPDEALLVRELERLGRSLRSALGGEALPAPPPAELDRLRLLCSLRAEVVRDWSGDDAGLLAVMRAFEATQDTILENGEGAGRGDVLGSYARGLIREIAHMLRSPLGSIVMLADIMRDRGDAIPPETRDKQLAIIHRAALGVASIADDLVGLVDEDDSVGPTRAFGLSDALNAVADVVRPVTEVRACELTTHASGRERWSGPLSSVTRALLGLALGAVVRTRDGVIHLTATATDDDVVDFEVVARGDGAAPQDGDHGLFQIFRLEPDDASYTLSAEGMGLVATRRLIHAMGSELSLGVETEGELRLSFSLPLRPSP